MLSEKAKRLRNELNKSFEEHKYDVKFFGNLLSFVISAIDEFDTRLEIIEKLEN